MDWKWALLTIAVTVAGLLVCHVTTSAVDEEHCPYKVGTDRTDCNGRPCEAKPPCRCA